MTSTQIVQVRNSLGLTQAAFGKLLGVHSLTVSRWERGGLVPSAYHVDLMRTFARARRQQPDIGEVIAPLILGATIGAALYHLLGAAFRERGGRGRSRR
jgi:putative transcriptional regulator